MLTRLVLLSIATILAVALPFAPASAQQKEVVIGMLYPLSGPTASGGLDEKHAFELFADMVNGKEPMIPGAFYQKLKGLSGLPGGARLRLVFVDHQGKPDLGQAEAERLITQEKVHALIGSWQSSVTATTSQVAERFGVPHLSAESASPGLTRRGFKWFFRTSPARRALQPGDVRLPGGLPEEEGHQGRDGRDLQRGHAVRDRLGQGAARARAEGRLQARRRLRLPRQQHVAHGRGAEAEGREPRRVVPDLVPVRRDPLHADVQGARLEPEDHPGPERRAHRPEVHRGDRARTPRGT